mmetsp:Transcript_52812/g.103262  ORF Transcript_52812/g.103262 Transcript_52812/m.103262 type:complete len:289 (+) Transcript_52812:261-1127(+)
MTEKGIPTVRQDFRFPRQVLAQAGKIACSVPQIVPRGHEGNPPVTDHMKGREPTLPDPRVWCHHKMGHGLLVCLLQHLLVCLFVHRQTHRGHSQTCQPLPDRLQVPNLQLRTHKSENHVSGRQAACQFSEAPMLQHKRLQDPGTHQIDPEGGRARKNVESSRLLDCKEKGQREGEEEGSLEGAGWRQLHLAVGEVVGPAADVVSLQVQRGGERHGAASPAHPSNPFDPTSVECRPLCRSPCAPLSGVVCRQQSSTERGRSHTSRTLGRWALYRIPPCSCFSSPSGEAP